MPAIQPLILLLYIILFDSVCAGPNSLMTASAGQVTVNWILEQTRLLI